MDRETETVEVLLPTVFDRTLSYRAPNGTSLPPGTLVAAPLGPRALLGAVWDQTGAEVDAAKLRAIERVLDLPPLREELRKFVDWVAAYTLNPRGQVLRAVLRGAGDDIPDPPGIGFRATGLLPPRMTPAREKVLARAADGQVRGRLELARVAGVSPGVVDGLISSGALEGVEVAAGPVAAPRSDHHGPKLETAQRAAGETLREAVRACLFEVVLLDGVTGSGKTEVYFEAVAEALRCGRQALVLVPEIALTEPFLERFAQRFGARPAAWHAGVAPKRRTQIWNGISRGTIRAVVGARSALFLPFADLGLIVVDEEHDTAYKQEEMLIYNARDMAIVRGRLATAPVILASATPSVETRVNADRGRYTHLRLPERFGSRAMPQVETIDLRVAPPPRGRFMAGPLVAALQAGLERGEQGLLFLNRRGYAPLTLCRACGHRFGCPNCSAWLVEHRFENRLRCHHCGHVEPLPHKCPACGTEGRLVPVGPGVERLRDEVSELFPDARLSVLSSDLAGAERLRSEIAAISAGEVDLVIGTQIVTKGHNFPNLTLVGVIDADLGFSSSDPRAAERTFQVLEQVTGRAGRGDRAGRALLQTHDPDHPVIRAIVSGDREAFYAAEIVMRADAGLPPFERLAGLIISGTDRHAAELYARTVLRSAPGEASVQLLGPAQAPLSLVRGRFRFRILARSARSFDLSSYVRRWLAVAPPPRGSIRVAVDIDPQSFL